MALLSWFPYACVFLAALLGCVITTPTARRIAVRAGAIDVPSRRRVNTHPIPRMGGISIFLGLAAAAVVQWLGTTYLGWPVVLVSSPKLSVTYHGIVASMVAIFIVGLVDDVKSLKPLPKLIGQILAATIAAASGLLIGNIVNPFGGPEIALGPLAYPVTIIYLVAFANIVNLIDGLDGLAAGIACISSFTMFILSMLSGRADAATFALALCGSTLGFLRYNFSPACIFMGDSGSLLLGFSLGCISLLSVTRVAGITTLLLPLVLAGIPIIDTFSAIVRRKRAHVSVGQADRGHIHHRLIAEGFDQRQAVVLIYLWTAALCLGAVIMTQVEVGPRIAVFCLLVAMSAVFVIKLKLFQPVLLHHYDDQGNDELIGPDDPSFKEEAHRQHMDS